MATVKTVTIANGGTQSTPVEMQGYRLVAIELGVFTGATITFEWRFRSSDTFQGVVNSAGSALSLTATDSKLILVDNLLPAPLDGQLRLVSAGAEAAERTIKLILAQP